MCGAAGWGGRGCLPDAFQNLWRFANRRNKKGVLVHDRDLFFFFFRVAIATAQRLQG